MFRRRNALVVLLQDVVGGGASVGFLPPPGAEEAHSVDGTLHTTAFYCKLL